MPFQNTLLPETMRKNTETTTDLITQRRTLLNHNDESYYGHKQEKDRKRQMSSFFVELLRRFAFSFLFLDGNATACCF
jgi:hypothetical protein